MKFIKSNLIKYINFFPVILFCIYFLSKDYSSLGFFADDANTLFILNQNISFQQLFHHSHNWDAARDLHLIWQKIFIILSKPEIIQNLHLYQVIFFLINSFLLIKILQNFELSNETCLIIWIFYLFFPAYSEVVFWTHAFTMVLISTFFFLIFILLNIFSIKKLKKFSNLIIQFLILITFILTLFTYEQPIFAAFFLIVLINFIKLKKKIINKKTFLSIAIFYFFLIALFSLYKLYSAGLFHADITKYHTGSKVNIDVQFLKNIFVSFSKIIFEIINIDISVQILKKNYFLIIIFNFLIFFALKNFFLKKKYFFKKKSIKKLKINILICFVFFILSFLPIYFHYLSDRHFYLPSIFMFIGLAFLIECIFFSILNKAKFNIFFIFIIFLFCTKFMIQYDQKKYQNINNFQMKKFFYNEILDSNKININSKYIYLYDFPDLYKNEILFAHEQELFLKVLKNNNNLPSIMRNPKEKNLNNSIHFKEIKYNKIIYDIK